MTEQTQFCDAVMSVRWPRPMSVDKARDLPSEQFWVVENGDNPEQAISRWLVALKEALSRGSGEWIAWHISPFIDSYVTVASPDLVWRCLTCFSLPPRKAL